MLRPAVMSIGATVLVCWRQAPAVIREYTTDQQAPTGNHCFVCRLMKQWLSLPLVVLASSSRRLGGERG
jgi:hypothetical protein